MSQEPQADAKPYPTRARIGPRGLRGLPLRFVIPNVVTLLALCAGLTAIRLAADGHLESAVLAIVVAAVLDGVDGRIARALKGSTRFGAELDSLADFIDFGVAPGLVLYFWSLHQLGTLGWVAVLFFAIAAALRLARFNVMIDDPDRPAWMTKFFTGMPAPAGAIVVLLPLYLHLVFGFETTPKASVLEAGYVLLVALLMASRIPHYSGKSLGRVPRDKFIFVLFVVAAALVMLAFFPMQMLIGLSLLYLGMIPASIRAYKTLAAADGAGETARKDEPDAAQVPPA
ncbi:CDP-diacylglycerol--serine O-phosphatidyltransferase [Rhodoblastus acidophilus]|uniref:CDP-diacylglycerol--serine O-phosphatidyltransferase n=1 Tax=Rhodoblastus acidophilus TaxID=1074 RepID=A0A212RKF1_RHOAC|nr:phosphatidylcholine/phosphatidylserine synthase [Rhodoblastus acidophilus]MCW2315908.1 CDP-diacylglycerol--serine O-phosphatidyltransferase [Rhodoblastus acidophilus]PPQ35994.1 CDP-diacylglycerol--serine O-phosphatidyltransferase [Rhodoblastus acidophilus]RAI18311.1 CDP-diacylglycerol--serine O-phosphatidyltransferase [Rhodoblastus acidophilus]SNB72950.1 CDP-diacylglycerol--serine O-phosphatidyltransferase [Rhodoblastus acidophilus]